MADRTPWYRRWLAVAREDEAEWYDQPHHQPDRYAGWQATPVPQEGRPRLPRKAPWPQVVRVLIHPTWAPKDEPRFGVPDPSAGHHAELIDDDEEGPL